MFVALRLEQGVNTQMVSLIEPALRNRCMVEKYRFRLLVLLACT